MSTAAALARRAIAALPDAVTAGLYLLVWISPLTLGAIWVKNLMVVMLLEFLTVHSGAFIGAPLADPNVSRGRKVGIVLGFGAFYMLFATGFSLAFDAWWPAAAFGWLLLAKFMTIFVNPDTSGNETRRQHALLAAGITAYVGGMFFTALVPMPDFGITAEVRAAAAIPGSGHWVEHPESVIAFGFLYFSLMAAAKASVGSGFVR